MLPPKTVSAARAALDAALASEEGARLREALGQPVSALTEAQVAWLRGDLSRLLRAVGTGLSKDDLLAVVREGGDAGEVLAAVIRGETPENAGASSPVVAVDEPEDGPGVWESAPSPEDVSDASTVVAVEVPENGPGVGHPPLPLAASDPGLATSEAVAWAPRQDAPGTWAPPATNADDPDAESIDHAPTGPGSESASDTGESGDIWTAPEVSPWAPPAAPAPTPAPDWPAPPPEDLVPMEDGPVEDRPAWASMPPPDTGTVSPSADLPPPTLPAAAVVHPAPAVHQMPAPTVALPRQQRRRGGRARWWVIGGVVAALGTIGALGWLAWDNQQTAIQWQGRYDLAAADAAALAIERDALTEDLATVQKALDRSEQDVIALEARVAGIANEKALVEDEREDLRALSNRLNEIAVAYGGVSDQFDWCVDEMESLASMYLDFDDYWYSGQYWRLTDQLDRATGACNGARDDAFTLRSLVNALQ